MASSMPPVPSRYKPVQSRSTSSAYCTHRTLTRLYDESRRQRCMICQRLPDFGYLYRCTQDTNGELPMSEFLDDNMVVDLADLRVRNPDVDDTTTTSNVNRMSPTSNLQTLSATIYTEDSNDDDDDVAIDEDLARALDGKRKFETAFPPKPAPQVEACNLKICQTCRPIFRDRAWQSLNRIVDTPIDPPPQHELENRRVSNVTTVSGLRLPRDTFPLPVVSSTVTTRENVHGTVHLPEMKQVSPRMPSVFNQSMAWALQDRAVEDGASDADDERGFANDNDTETDTSDADSSYHQVPAATGATCRSPRQGYYAPATVTDPYLGTRPGMIWDRALRPSSDYNAAMERVPGGRGSTRDEAKPEPKLSKGRFYID